MRARLLVGLLVGGMVLGIGQRGTAHGDEDLPAGPIRDRHELMEDVGKQAKIIGDAMKSGKLDPVGGAADKIRSSAAKALPLFPEGSTHVKSRAKPEIWKNWSDFEASMKKLETDAAAVVAASKTNGDVRGAAQEMFGNCKSCHNEFRLPEKD